MKNSQPATIQPGYVSIHTYGSGQAFITDIFLKPSVVLGTYIYWITHPFF
ncbi:hypothetical protein G6554_12585 [Bacillus sp. MM2020_4]|nr:hypothetical protein [Bacillus sp. MM2020_4]